MASHYLKHFGGLFSGNQMLSTSIPLLLLIKPFNTDKSCAPSIPRSLRNGWDCVTLLEGRINSYYPEPNLIPIAGGLTGPRG
jgi:hypothetical protein